MAELLADCAAHASPPLVLRDYQREAIAAIRAAQARGVQKPVVQLPTGAGKTVVFATLIAEEFAAGRWKRALILVHRDELAHQARDKILAVWPAATVGLVKGQHNDIAAPIIIGSVQTLARKRRRDRLPRDFDAIIIDECHHATAKSYQDILEDLA